jgi:FkbM family methyltransferase
MDISQWRAEKGGSAETELDKLLSEDIVSAKNRENSLYGQLSEPFYKSLVLFGAGYLGRKVLAGLCKKDIQPLAFVDNDPTKWGQSIDGLQVLSPQEGAKRFYNTAAFIVTIWNPHHSYLHTRQQLLTLNCPKVIPFAALFWKYPDVFLPYYQFDVPHRILERSSNIKKAFALLSDEESRQQFAAQLRWRMLLDFEGLPTPSPQDQYFSTDIISFLSSEVFVDCGAFDGDTVRSFLKRRGSIFKKIVAFEPDTHNFEKLLKFLSTLDKKTKSKIIALNCAVGAQRDKVHFDALGTAGSFVSDAGFIEVDSISLDEKLVDDTTTFLKFDIEGAELDALVGAQHVIRRAKPIVAVCVCHRPDDLWMIPLYLHSLNRDYHIFFRAHGDEGLDLVCYAIPPHRLTYQIKRGQKDDRG